MSVTVRDVQSGSYAQYPNSVQKIGRVALVAMNVGAAVGPMIGAIVGANNCTWLEVVWDSSVHILRLAAVLDCVPTQAANIIDGFRVAALVGGLSQFPGPAPILDLVAHSINLISGKVL